ncbi:MULTISPECIES: HNH endonuclease signature motif containing protein [Burkholderia]|uniref:HNH endonuclease signature motif containing protein n=1 Tax=Burkholderia TaxID=32008 RepID=UPI00158DB79D|nr:HNH endonuclease signature motif containing protein [Burkholderia ambifaria]
MKSELTAERARELLNYDPATGEFRWKVTRNNRTRAGSVAGAKEVQGYHVIKIDGRTYKAHRLAWLIVTGAWPTSQIDHIDHDRSNNRFSNFREATNQENHRNKRMRRINTSGVTGVNRVGNKWHARIAGPDGTRINLGRFWTIEQAARVREEALERFGYHKNHGR